jgi:hypothetical protein
VAGVVRASGGNKGAGPFYLVEDLTHGYRSNAHMGMIDVDFPGSRGG